MTLPTDLRIRIERLLRGDNDVRDLDRLFQWLRDKTRGREEYVADIGDFHAHRDQRERGLTCDRVRDFCVINAFNMRQYDAKILRRALAINLRSLSESEVEQQLGVSRVEAERALDSLFLKITEAGPAGEKRARRFDVLEEHVFASLKAIHIMSRTAYSQNTLYEQFLACLISEGLVSRDEADASPGLSDFVAMYAVSQMHLAKVKFKEGYANLAAGTSSLQPGKIVVQAAYINENKLRFSGNVFVTDCDVAKYCPTHTDEIVLTGDPQIPYMVGVKDWTVPFELQHGVLSPLR